MPGGFNHYQQSLRVIDQLENDGQGLNNTVTRTFRRNLKLMANSWIPADRHIRLSENR